MKRLLAALVMLAACSSQSKPAGPVVLDTRSIGDIHWSDVTDPSNGRRFHCLTEQTSVSGIAIWCYELGLGG